MRPSRCVVVSAELRLLRWSCLQVVIQIAVVASSMLTLDGTCRPAATCASRCILESRQTALAAGESRNMLSKRAKCLGAAPHLLVWLLPTVPAPCSCIHVELQTAMYVRTRSCLIKSSILDSCLTIAGKQGSIKLRRVDKYGNALTSSAGEAHFVCSSAGPESLETQVIECANGIVDIRRASVLVCWPQIHRSNRSNACIALLDDIDGRACEPLRPTLASIGASLMSDNVVYITALTPACGAT